MSVAFQEIPRDAYQKQPLTREGQPFGYSSIAEFLTARESTVPVEFIHPDKDTVVCIDDGIRSTYGTQKFIPFSGSGAGEDMEVLARILSGARKIKSHRNCGKANLVLTHIREKLDLSSPSQEEVDIFAENSTKQIGVILGIPNGRMLNFDDKRRTHLSRPEENHPADGAIISLSNNLFLHNLIGSDQESETSPQFRLAGDYYRKIDSPSDPLFKAATNEAALAWKIASGQDGIGLVERGFNYTFLINADDPDKAKLVQLANIVYMSVQIEQKNLLQQGEQLNEVRMNIVEYSVQEQNGLARVQFNLAQ